MLLFLKIVYLIEAQCLVAQPCLTLYNPLNYSLPGSSVHGIFQARILVSSIHLSGAVVSNSLQPHGLKHARLPSPSPTPRACSSSCLWNRRCHATILTWAFPSHQRGCHFFLQGIFLTQGLNPHLLCLLHCRWILYLLSHWGSPIQAKKLCFLDLIS